MLWKKLDCFRCKQTRRFFIHAGKYGAFYSCEFCNRTINITRNADEAKVLFPEIYNENSISNEWLEYQEL